MKKKLGSALQVIGGLMATVGCILVFGVRLVGGGTPEGAWLVLGAGILGLVLLGAGIAMVHKGEKMEKQ